MSSCIKTWISFHKSLLISFRSILLISFFICSYFLLAQVISTIFLLFLCVFCVFIPIVVLHNSSDFHGNAYSDVLALWFLPLLLNHLKVSNIFICLHDTSLLCRASRDPRTSWLGKIVLKTTTFLLQWRLPRVQRRCASSWTSKSLRVESQWAAFYSNNAIGLCSLFFICRYILFFSKYFWEWITVGISCVVIMPEN